MRSKARWYENGENKSKYFLNLEKRNFLRKKISKLKLSNDEEMDNAKTILQEEKTFYKNLYSTRKCEGLLTEQECYQALKDMDNGKSPKGRYKTWTPQCGPPFWTPFGPPSGPLFFLFFWNDGKVYLISEVQENVKNSEQISAASDLEITISRCKSSKKVKVLHFSALKLRYHF